MDDGDKLSLFVKLKEHFHIATAGDCELLWRRTRKFSLADVKFAIEEHHVECGREAYRPSIDRLGELAHARHSKRSAPQPDRRIVDVLRDARPRETAGLDDEAVILLNARRAWDDRPAVLQEIGLLALRRMLIGQAMQALDEIGVRNDAAYAKAREAVGLKPGDVLPRTKVFREPEPPQKPIDALKQLARAEHLDLDQRQHPPGLMKGTP